MLWYVGTNNIKIRMKGVNTAVEIVGCYGTSCWFGVVPQSASISTITAVSAQDFDVYWHSSDKFHSNLWWGDVRLYGV